MSGDGMGTDGMSTDGMSTGATSSGARRLHVVLAAGLALGLLGDALLRVNAPPGLNWLLWCSGAALAAVLVQVRTGRLLSGEAVVALGIGVAFAAGFAWRDAPYLKLFALACGAVAFALPAFRAGRAWVRGSGIAENLHAVAGAGAHAALGAIPVLIALDWGAVRDGAGRSRSLRRATAGLRGIFLALPFLLLFGALFMAADAVFADIVADVIRMDFERLTEHVAITAFLAWVTTGYLRGLGEGTALPLPPGMRRPALGAIEVGVALLLLNTLFLAFVLVQFRYLFGGSTMIEVTHGLTYAEYARRGFFELVFATLFVLPLLLAADATLHRASPRDERSFRVLSGVQIALAFAIMASALQRMRLYQAAYGLTVDRFLASALLILIGVLLLWFAATVLSGRRTPFAFGTLVAGFATVAVLFAVNPEAVVARANLTRAQRSGDPSSFDVSYATSLGADAVPALLAGLSTLPESHRCIIARRMLDRWGPDSPPLPLRAWNLAVARARAAVQARSAPLRVMAGTGERCPP